MPPGVEKVTSIEGVTEFAFPNGLHVLLLPPATALLIATHIYLVRKHGVAPAPGDEVARGVRYAAV